MGVNRFFRRPVLAEHVDNRIDNEDNRLIALQQQAHSFFWSFINKHTGVMGKIHLIVRFVTWYQVLVHLVKRSSGSRSHERQWRLRWFPMSVLDPLCAHRQPPILGHHLKDNLKPLSFLDWQTAGKL